MSTKDDVMIDAGVVGTVPLSLSSRPDDENDGDDEDDEDDEDDDEGVDD